MAATATPSKGPKGDKLMRDALMVALKRPSALEPDKRQFTIIAEKVVDLAIEGDREMAKLIFDRIDGKAVQPIANDGEPFEQIIQVITGVPRAG